MAEPAKNGVVERFRWDRVFCVVAVAAAVGSLGQIIVTEAPLGITGRRPHDFAHYYVAGERVTVGANPYAPVTTRVKELLAYDGYDAPVADAPLAVVLFASLTALPYGAAWIVFATLSTLACAVSAAWVCYTLRFSGWITCGIVAAVLASRPFRQLMIYNHMEWLVLATMVAGWIVARRGSAWGGALWGAAAALKLFPATLLLSSLAGRHYRLTGWIAASGIGLTLLGAWLVGWQHAWEYASVVVPAARRYYTWSGNSSLMAIGTVLSNGSAGGYALTAAGFVGLAIVLLRRRGSIDRAFATGSVAGLILSPLSWIYYGILAFPALILLGSRCNWDDRRERSGFILLAAILLFWPLGFVENLPLSAGTFLLLVVPRTLAYAVLFVWSAAKLE